METSRVALLSRKRDIYAAIRALEQDHREGTVDDLAYLASRRRFEEEAADIIEQLDQLPSAQREEVPGRQRVSMTLRSQMLIAAGVGLGAAGILILLLIALHARTSHSTATANPPGGSLSIRARLASDTVVVRRHPRNIVARIELGNAYLEDGQPEAADRSYRAAMGLAPGRPEAASLHAMILGTYGHRSQGLKLLHQIERTHPRYSRAWLLDGLISSHSRPLYAHAIAAWQRFLALEPHSAIAPQVRIWIARTRAAQKARR